MNETSPSSQPVQPARPSRLYLAISRLCATVHWLALLLGVVAHLTKLFPKDVSSTPDEGVVHLQLNEGTRAGQESLAHWVRDDRSLQAVTEHLEADQKFIRAYGILIPLTSLLTFMVLRLHSCDRVALPLALTAILAIGSAALIDELLENPALDRLKVEAAASGRRGTLDTRMVNSALARDLDDLRLSAITKFLLVSLGTAANIGIVAVILRRQPLLARIGVGVVLVGLGVLCWRGTLTDMPLVGVAEQLVGASQTAIESLLRLVSVSAGWRICVWLGALVVCLVIADAASSSRRSASDSAVVRAPSRQSSWGGRLAKAVGKMLVVALAAPGLWLVVLFFTSGIPLSVLISSLVATALTGVLLMAALNGTESEVASTTSPPRGRRTGPLLAGYAAILVAVTVTGVVTHEILRTAEQAAIERSAKQTARDADAWADWSRMIGAESELVILKSPDEAPRPGTGGGGRGNAALETTSIPLPLGDRRLFALGIGWLLAAIIVGFVALLLGAFKRKRAAATAEVAPASTGQVMRRLASCLLGAGVIWIAAASLWLGATYLSRGNPLGVGMPLVGAVLSLALFGRSLRQAESGAATPRIWGTLAVLSLVGTFAWVWLRFASHTPLVWVATVAVVLVLLSLGLVARSGRAALNN